MTRVPWHVKGNDPEARQDARPPPRQSGFSVGQWLSREGNSEPAGGDRNAGAGGDTSSTAPPGLEGHPSAASEEDPRFGVLSRQVDDLTSRIKRLLQSSDPQSEGLVSPAEEDTANSYPCADSPSPDERLDFAAGAHGIDLAVSPSLTSHGRPMAPDSIADVLQPVRPDPYLAGTIARIDRQLEAMRHNERGGAQGETSSEINEALVEIAARQKALELEPPEEPASSAAPVCDSTQSAAGTTAGVRLQAVEQQIKLLSRPSRPDEPTIEASTDISGSSSDIAEHSPIETSSSTAVAPRPDAIAALEEQLRRLTSRLEAAPDTLEQQVNSLRLDFGAMEKRIEAALPSHTNSELQELIATLSEEVAKLSAPLRLDDLAGSLRADLAETRAALKAAGPHGEVASIEGKLDVIARDVAGLYPPLRIDDIADALRHDLVEIGNVVRSATPTEDAASNGGSIDLPLRDGAPTDAVRLPVSDLAAIGSLEQRVGGLAEELHEAQARLGRLDTVERGIAELEMLLKDLRAQNANTLEAIQHQLAAGIAAVSEVPGAATRRDIAMLKEIQSAADQRTQDTFEAVYGTVEQIVDRLAIIEQDLHDREAQRPGASQTAGLDGRSRVTPSHSGPYPDGARETVESVPYSRPEAPTLPSGISASGAPAGAAIGAPAAASGTAHQAIVSGLPPDSPLEPGSGGRRVRVVADALDRIAASEAINAEIGDKPASLDEAGEPHGNFVAAARRAAQAVAGNQDSALPTDQASQGEGRRVARLMKEFWPRIKAVVFAAGVVVLMLGTLYWVLDPFSAPELRPPGPQVGLQISAAAQTGKAIAPEKGTPAAASAIPSTDAAIAQASGSAVSTESPAASPAIALAASAMGGGTTLPADRPPVPPLQSLAGLPPVSAPADTVARELAPLPVSIGGKVLLDAAAAGDPNASYEIAVRFAEGRNVPQDLGRAAAWFDRAARRGLAPAQFRLGSMYEKGLGVKKDLQEARRLYVAAADKGNAKAMHNLAVLYAEGLDGNPDYTVAAQWFHRAAQFGVADSQYNLAILYARGIGVEHNLMESYKWFTLAARSGDKDAAKKRDEIATRLDPQQLESAKQAAEAFVAERQPAEAVAAKTWDEVASPPVKRKASR